jgi:hypothetical protein
MSSAHAFDRSPFDRSVGGTDPKQEISDGVALAKKISALVKATAPYAYCLSCLADAMMAPERKIRDAAQFAVIQDGFCIRLRVCHRCGRTEDTITVNNGT